jgi:hypothetical protein
MAGEVSTDLSIELVLGPHSESVRAELAEAPDWSEYAAELRRVLATAIEKSDVDFLEVGELLVSQPLPGGYASLRNGVDVPPSEAIDLVEGMVAGNGPYCRLSMSGRLLIESGWDGAVHLYVTPTVAMELAGFRSGDVSLEWRSAVPDPVDVSKPVDTVADEGFWDAVWEVSERVTLLCERWAHGAYGCRWFRVTRENLVEVAKRSGLVRYSVWLLSRIWSQARRSRKTTSPPLRLPCCLGS